VRRLAAVVLLALAGLPALAHAQRPDSSSRRTLLLGRDSTAVDTAAGDSARAQRELVRWREADSLMNALLQRPGYVSTRYQGERVQLEAQVKRISLAGDAAVQRESATLVSDSIVYDDSTDIIVASGDTVVLRDPTQQEADLVAFGWLRYDVRARRGVGQNIVSATEQNGQTWFVEAHRAAIRSDTTRNRQVFYGLGGDITTCELTEPHYHFATKEVKVVGNRFIVARPAVLYIADIPVLWLPFIYQDTRSGRRSGVLPPRLGFSDIVRNTPSYRRQIENLGYYFALNDYMDFEASLDWRSGARESENDPGWLRWNGEWNYRWLDRFLSGRMAISRTNFSNGQSNTGISWTHQQQFSQRSNLNASINYVTSTTLYRQQSFNVAQTLATISSQVNYQQELGPASISLGGSRSQFPGRDQVNQDFPNFSLSTRPVNVGEWLVWTPQLSVSNSQQFNKDQFSGLRYRFVPDGLGGVDSVAVEADERNTSVSFSTPLRIFGFNWQNSFTVSDLENDFPQEWRVLDPATGDLQAVRTYEKTFRTSIRWETGIQLPSLFQGTWNLVPSVAIADVSPEGFWVRTHLSGGKYVTGTKRLQYGLNVSPTFFGFLPGFGPFSRIRHSLQPRLSYNFAPSATLSDEYYAATGRTRTGSLAGIRQNALTFSLNQVFEAKLRPRPGDDPERAEKIRLLMLDFSPLSYDFERARQTGASGFATSNFTWRASSDLLPGFDLSVGYSLFQGDILSDTAKFDPYRTSISASLNIGRDNNPLTRLSRIFGKAVPQDTTIPAALQGGEGPFANPPSIAGSSGARAPFTIDRTRGWNATFTFTSSRQRPPVGGNVIEFDPEAFCRRIGNVDPILFNRCLDQERQRFSQDTGLVTAGGGPIVRVPPITTLRSSLSFGLTEHWSTQWSTGYDFERREFADHVVSLQRELHDWNAIFAFTKSPNGNFAFNFFISLKAEPDLKFDYNERTYRNPVR
jgi:hypothetical protein